MHGLPLAYIRLPFNDWREYRAQASMVPMSPLGPVYHCHRHLSSLNLSNSMFSPEFFVYQKTQIEDESQTKGAKNHL